MAATRATTLSAARNSMSTSSGLDERRVRRRRLRRVHAQPTLEVGVLGPAPSPTSTTPVTWRPTRPPSSTPSPAGRTHQREDERFRLATDSELLCRRLLHTPRRQRSVPPQCPVDSHRRQIPRQIRRRPHPQRPHARRHPRGVTHYETSLRPRRRRCPPSLLPPRRQHQRRTQLRQLGFPAPTWPSQQWPLCWSIREDVPLLGIRGQVTQTCPTGSDPNVSALRPPRVDSWTADSTYPWTRSRQLRRAGRRAWQRPECGAERRHDRRRGPTRSPATRRSVLPSPHASKITPDVGADNRTP